MPEYTSGPWKIINKDTGGYFTKGWKEIVGPGSHCTVVMASAYDSNKYGTVCGVRIADKDANLITAAPDLLEAAKKLNDFRKGKGSFGIIHPEEELTRLCIALEKAIAKAEGGDTNA